MPRSYYSESIKVFINSDTDHVLGVLTRQHLFDLNDLQKTAWLEQIEILKQVLTPYPEGHILFEYSIPRMGKRVDVVLLIKGLVFILEFKVGESQYFRNAIDQVLDYALDLKNFHEQSHNRPIIPIMVATEAISFNTHIDTYEDNIFVPLKANKDNLGSVISTVLSMLSAPALIPQQWQDSSYEPTPTIIEAAQALYQSHDVREISRSDAGAINLSLTADAIFEIIEHARSTNKKTICFVTGVPGAGKTLAGLNIANQRLKTSEDEYSVFLSGNGPLVRVLQEALARSVVENNRLMKNTGIKKREALSKTRAFIQNIHHFRDDALVSDKPPLEKVVVFDEAQRAWTLEQTSSFMKRKRKISDFSMSEPQFLISYMDRHPDWAVVICLIGGGQEINTGEAGLLEWFEAIRSHFPNWQVCYSPNLTDDEYTRGENIQGYPNPEQVKVDARLHLSVSIRSFRAESVSGFVKAVLDNDLIIAKKLYQDFASNYPIKLTRDLDKAKDWLKSKARGTERYGLLASSGGIRLRPIGLNVQMDVDVVNWFLNGKEDIRSSYYLEEVATEFDVQGLELDWTCIGWDADLRYGSNNWEYKSFRGTKWQNINDDLRKRYLRNAYRVLLTRARQGMVIFVPVGNNEDNTRKPMFYDRTFNYLHEIGLELL